MQKLLSMIHNEHRTILQQFCVTILVMMLILVLVLSVPIQTAKAVAVIDDILISAVCSIFLSLGIKYATDADWRHGANDFIINAGQGTIDAIKRQIDYIVTDVSYIGYGFQMMFDPETWKIICGDVQHWYGTAYSDATKNIIPGVDGTIGFTAGSQFSVALPGGTVQIRLNEYSILTLDGTAPVPYSYSSLPHTSESYLKPDGDYKNKYGHGSIFSCIPFDLHYYSYSLVNEKNVWQGNLKSDIENGYKSFSYVKCTFSSSVSGFGNQAVQLLNTTISNSDTHMYTINGKLAYFVKCSDNRYRFVSTTDGQVSSATDDTCIPLVNNLTNDTYYSFSDNNEMYYTVFDACGLRHYTDSKKNESLVDDYVPVPLPITDTVPDVYSGSQSVGITVPDELVKSNDMTNLNEMDPADVIEYVDTVTVEFPDGVPNIDSSGLFDKFPFCLPYDVYNLFTGFSAEAVAPKFTIPLNYSDFDLTFTIDFADFEVFAQITRWFVSISFVYGLIVLTKKIMS